MNEQIQVGDTVELKSGGPTMTVDEIGNVDRIPKAWCSWFHDTEHKKGVFPLTSLVKTR
jgi:uncharacterized protein YodC (DUF2158 family)